MYLLRPKATSSTKDDRGHIGIYQQGLWRGRGRGEVWNKEGCRNAGAQRGVMIIVQSPTAVKAACNALGGGERREEDGGEGQKSKEPQALGSEGRTYIKQGSGTERKGMVDAQG